MVALFKEEDGHRGIESVPERTRYSRKVLQYQKDGYYKDLPDLIVPRDGHSC